MVFVLDTKKIEAEKKENNSDARLAIESFLKLTVSRVLNIPAYGRLSDFNIFADGLRFTSHIKKTIESKEEYYIKPDVQKVDDLKKEYFKLVNQTHIKVMETLKIPNIFKNVKLETAILSEIYFSVAKFAVKNEDFTIALNLIENAIRLDTLYKYYGGLSEKEIMDNAPTPNQKKRLELEPKATELSRLILSLDEYEILYPIDIAKIIKELLKLKIQAETIRDKWKLDIPREVSERSSVKREDIAKLEAEILSASIIKELRKDFL